MSKRQRFILIWTGGWLLLWAGLSWLINEVSLSLFAIFLVWGSVTGYFVSSPRRWVRIGSIILMILIILAVLTPGFYHPVNTNRAGVSEGVNLAGAAKLAVAETWAEKGMFPKGGNDAYGLPAPQSIAGNHVQSITVVDDGKIIT